MTPGKDFDGTLRAKVKYFAREPRVQDVVTCREDTGRKAARGSEGRWLLALKVPRPQARRVPEDRRPAPPPPEEAARGARWESRYDRLLVAPGARELSLTASGRKDTHK